MAICSGKVYWVECDRCYNAVAHQETTPEKAERLARTAGYIETEAEWLCQKCAAITQKKRERDTAIPIQPETRGRLKLFKA